MDISLVIPAYNEENCLGKTIAKITEYMNTSGLSYEIILVNDGSKDETLDLALNLAVKYPPLLVKNHQVNLGKGAAVKTGVLSAKGDLILFLDADYSTRLDELPAFLTAAKSGADIVIGSRSLKQSKIIVPQKKLKIIFGKLGNKMIKLLTGLDFKDTQCGFKLFKAKVKKIFYKQTLEGWGFDFELLHLARKYGFKTLELPVKWFNDPTSSVKPMDYVKTLFELIKIKFNDLRGFYEKN